MSENQHNWIAWARTLQRWGLKEATATVLETAGSLNMLVAQLLYLGQPLLSGTLYSGSLNSFAQLLENPSDRKEFASFLSEASPRGTGA